MRGLRDDIYTSLKHGILTGNLAPGDQLRLRNIATQHEASMMPVREAIVGLEAAGLVTQIPYRGAFVSGLTVEKLQDFYRTRLVIESGAIQIAAPMLQAAHFEKMCVLLNDIDAEASKDNWPLVIDLDERFLMTIYEAVDSTSLVEIIQTVWNRVTPYKHHLFAVERSAAYEIMRDNRELLSILRDGDAQAAQQLLESSLRTAMRTLSDALAA